MVNFGAASASTWNRVSISNTRMAPISFLVSSPWRQISGSSHLGSALRSRPTFSRNQTPFCHLARRGAAFMGRRMLAFAAVARRVLARRMFARRMFARLRCAVTRPCDRADLVLARGSRFETASSSMSSGAGSPARYIFTKAAASWRGPCASSAVHRPWPDRRRVPGSVSSGFCSSRSWSSLRMSSAEGGIAPGRVDAGAAQHFLGAAAARRRHQQDADALLAGAAGAAAAMLQHLRRRWAGRHGSPAPGWAGRCRAPPRRWRRRPGRGRRAAPAAHGCARSGDSSPDSATRKSRAPVSCASMWRTALRVLQNTSAPGGSRKRSRLTTARSILLPAMRMARYSISAWPRRFAARGDAQRILLVMRRQGDDGLGQGGGEQQGAPFRRRGFQDELQVFAKAHVEHLVGFVQHRRPSAHDTFRARRSR